MESFIVNIQCVNWIDKEGLEADVLFKLNGKEFWAFCHPCDFNEGETAEVYFDFIEEEISDDVFWEENKKERRDILTSEKNRCRYFCYGQLKEIHPVKIDCGSITFSFGDWINDENVIGSYIYFVISRLDISRV